MTEESDLDKLRRIESATTAPAEQLVGDILAALPTVLDQHARSTSLYAALRDSLAPAIRCLFSSDGEPRQFGAFGQISLPYQKMGAVDSRDLFGLDELMIFAFYWANRQRYRRVADVGANIGLHSIILGRCNYDVRSYEPDPRHADVLQTNLVRNNVQSVELRRAGVSDHSGEAEFVRVLGNTTSSHIAGSKDPYGELERFTISLEDIRDVLSWADLIKFDVEGHEATIFCAREPDAWCGCDVIAEIGTADSARRIYDHFKDSPVTLFSQKTGWRPVRRQQDMPVTYREGSLFVTSLPEMPWGEPVRS